MNDETRLQAYVDEERETRLRLARFKAKLYARPQDASPASQMRLSELQRQWDGALARLRAARRRNPPAHP